MHKHTKTQVNVGSLFLFFQKNFNFYTGMNNN